MAELLITSSILILAVLAARALLKKRISRRMQYALWGLVLLRLLLPVSLPESRASVLNYLPQTAVQQQAAAPAPAAQPDVPVQTEPQAASAARPVQGQTALSQPMLQTGGQAGESLRLSLAQWLAIGWLAGAAVTGGVLLAANLHFARRLKKGRVRLERMAGPLPVYRCEGLTSPCLHGLVKPAVYLNPAALEREERLAFVLAHELTHYRHKDHIWGALRCVCLAVYWFDPLVWLAAVVSKQDCELACDEAVTAAMEPEKRLGYGRCLVELIPRKAPGMALLAATSMGGGAAQMRRRLQALITAKKPRRAAIALTLAGAALLCACTFTGAQMQEVTDIEDLVADGETVRSHFTWQRDSGEEELLLVQAPAPEGWTLSEDAGWFKLYYWNSQQENTAQSALRFEGELLTRDPMHITAQLADGSSGRYRNSTADETVQVRSVLLLVPGGSTKRYEWTAAGLGKEETLPLPTVDPSNVQYDKQEKAVEQLLFSILPAENGLVFTIPETQLWTGTDWDISLWRPEGESMQRIEEGLPEEFNSQNWQAGQSYLIPRECLTDGPVGLVVRLADQPGGDVMEAGWTMAVSDVLAKASNLYGGGTFYLTSRTLPGEELPWKVMASQERDDPKQQALEELWHSCRWQGNTLSFTVPQGLSSETEEIHLYWEDPGLVVMSERMEGDLRIRAIKHINGLETLLDIYASDALTGLDGQSWQPGQTISVDTTGQSPDGALALILRNKATREEQLILLPGRPDSQDQTPAPSSAPAQAESGSGLDWKRLTAFTDSIQWDEEAFTLTFTIPENAQPGEWKLNIMRHNASRGSWVTQTEGLPEEFVSQDWQPGQTVTVTGEMLDTSAQWKLEMQNTILGSVSEREFPQSAA